MKKVLGLAVIGLAAAFIASRKRANMHHRREEDAQFRRDLERFEGEGGPSAAIL